MKCRSSLRMYAIRCMLRSGHAGEHYYQGVQIGSNFRLRGRYVVQWLKTR